MEESSAEFLGIVLPTLGRMQESVDVLHRHARSADHRDAAADVLSALCSSLNMFSRVALPQLLGEAEPMPVNAGDDRAWLSDFGYSLHGALHRLGFWWPPPEQDDPPAIVNDLHDMYDQLAFRHQYLAAVNRQTLIAVVLPVQEKACYLARELWVAKPLPPNPTGQRRGRAATAFTRSIAVVVTITGLMQAPQVINDFPQEWEEFSRDAGRALTIAANNAVDLAFDVAEMFDQ
jgi:hypothetical protein